MLSINLDWVGLKEFTVYAAGRLWFVYHALWVSAQEFNAEGHVFFLEENT